MDRSIRNLIDGVYDIQKLRIATGNRVVAALRGVVEETDNTPKSDAQREKDQREKDSALKKILGEYKNITDAYVEIYHSTGPIIKAISDRGGDYIKTTVDYSLVEQYLQLKSVEDGMGKVVASEVQQHPMWTAFFEGVKGCGPLMAAVCLAYLDPYAAPYVSSFWRYCGLDVVWDEERQEMRGNGRWYTEPRTYINKDGEEAERRSLTYNPFVKTKLVEVLVGSFLKAGDNHYSRIYRDYRNRRASKGDTPIQQHRRAARYCAKMFLQDMWLVWRDLEGLPVNAPYAEAKLGNNPHHTTK